MNVAVDCETSGLDPLYHEILTVAILPLDANWQFNSKIVPFHLKLKPRFPDRADPKAMSVNKLKMDDLLAHGKDQLEAANMLEKWFEYTGSEQFTPVASNWSFDRSFLIQWLTAPTFTHIFSRYAADTARVGQFINDWARANGYTKIFNSVSLKALAKYFNINNKGVHTAYHDALTTAEVYHALTRFDFRDPSKVKVR